jgi:hypothetical protein
MKNNLKKTTNKTIQKLNLIKYDTFLTNYLNSNNPNDLPTIKEIMTFQNEIKYVLNIGKKENHIQSFGVCLFYPYSVRGNQYVSGFDEFYNFISKYHLFESNEDYVLLFRGMGEEEYNSMKTGVKSPSWSNNPKVCWTFTVMEILNGNSDDSKLCWGLFKKEDIIISEPQFNRGLEGEFWVKKNSKPIEYGNIYTIGYEDLESVFKCDIDDLTLSHKECGNGYTHISSLQSKGLFDDSTNNRLLTKINSLLTEGLEKFVNKYENHPIIKNLSMNNQTLFDRTKSCLKSGDDLLKIGFNG